MICASPPSTKALPKYLRSRGIPRIKSKSEPRTRPSLRQRMIHSKNVNTLCKCFYTDYCWIFSLVFFRRDRIVWETLVCNFTKVLTYQSSLLICALPPRAPPLLLTNKISSAAVPAFVPELPTPVAENLIVIYYWEVDMKDRTGGQNIAESTYS